MSGSAESRRPGWELAELVGEVKELPGWPEVQAHTGLVMADCLRFLGWSDGEIAHLLGFNFRAYEETRVDTAEVPGYETSCPGETWREWLPLLAEGIAWDYRRLVRAEEDGKRA